MPLFPQHFASDVQDLLSANYLKIETQSSGFNYNAEIIKTFTFSLVDLNNPFQIDRFIDMLRLILTHFRIYFAVGYILRNEDVLRYYHPSIGNSCLLQTAFDVSSEEDLTRFKAEFERGNWLQLNL